MTYELKGVESFGFIWESLRNEGFLRSLVVNLRVTVDAIATKAERERGDQRRIKPPLMESMADFLICIFQMGRTVLLFCDPS